MPHRFVVTFIGDDRTGIVEQLAAAIAAAGGNWLDSRLAQLEGKFAGLILVALKESDVAPLQRALEALPGETLQVAVTPAGAVAAAGRPVQLTLTGPDRPGIVSEVSKLLAAAGINVVRFDSRVEGAPWSGEPLFRADLTGTLPEGQAVDAVREQLDAIAERMTLDIDFDS